MIDKLQKLLNELTTSAEQNDIENYKNLNLSIQNLLQENKNKFSKTSKDEILKNSIELWNYTTNAKISKVLSEDYILNIRCVCLFILIQICAKTDKDGQIRLLYMTNKIGNGWLGIGEIDKAIQISQLMDGKIKDLHSLKDFPLDMVLFEWCSKLMILKGNIALKCQMDIAHDDLNILIIKQSIQHKDLPLPANQEIENIIANFFNIGLIMYREKNFNQSCVFLELSTMISEIKAMESMHIETKISLFILYSKVSLKLGDDVNIQLSLNTIKKANSIMPSKEGLYQEICVYLQANEVDGTSLINTFKDLHRYVNSNWNLYIHSLRLLLERIEKDKNQEHLKNALLIIIEFVKSAHIGDNGAKTKINLILMQFYIMFDEVEKISPILNEILPHLDNASLAEEMFRSLIDIACKHTRDLNISSAINYYQFSQLLFDNLSNNNNQKLIVLRNLSRCFILKKNFVDALNCVEKALDLEPSSLETRIIKFGILLILEQIENAEHIFEMIIADLQDLPIDSIQIHILHIVHAICNSQTMIKNCSASLPRHLQKILIMTINENYFNVILSFFETQQSVVVEKLKTNSKISFEFLNYPIALIEHVLNTILIKIEQNSDFHMLSEIVKTINNIGLILRKYTIQAISIIQCSSKIIEKIDSINSNFAQLAVQTSFIQSLLLKSLIDQQLAVEIPIIEQCIVCCDKTIQKHLGSFSIDKEPNKSSITFKCAIIKMECLIILFNQNKIEKSLISKFIEDTINNESKLERVITDCDTIENDWFIKLLESFVSKLRLLKLNFYDECKYLLTKCISIAIKSKSVDSIDKYKCSLFDYGLENPDLTDILNTVAEISKDSTDKLRTYVGSRLWNYSISLFSSEKYGEAQRVNSIAGEMLIGLVNCEATRITMEQFQSLLNSKLEL